MKNHKGTACIVDGKTFCQEGYCSGCEIAKNIKVVWIKKRCIVCNSEFEYAINSVGYEPATCNSFDCVHKSLHKKEKANK